MGCKSSKDGAEGAGVTKGGHEAAKPTASDDKAHEKAHSGDGAHHGGSTVTDGPTSHHHDGPPKLGSGTATVTPAKVLEILQIMEATEEQREFFQSWSSHIFEHVPSASSRHVIFSTDMSWLEVRLCAEADLMCGLARTFVSSTGIPDKMLHEMEHVQSVLKAKYVTLWCKFKFKSVAIDAGFHLHEPLDWHTADVLMPNVDDEDALRVFAQSQSQAPSAYVSSLFPTEPEKGLLFVLHDNQEAAASQKKKSLLNAFFFFKSLGFAKPDDGVVRLLGSCQPKTFAVNITMGPKGLTRLSLCASEPGRVIAKDLAEALKFSFKADDLASIQNILCSEVDQVEYGADSRGYTVAVGFSMSGFPESK